MERPVELGHLHYYFDGQEKNCLDSGRMGRKAGQVMVLRQRLLNLPQEEFDQAIGAIERIVGDGPTDSEHQKHQQNSAMQSAQRAEALELFEKVSGSQQSGQGQAQTEVRKV